MRIPSNEPPFLFKPIPTLTREFPVPPSSNTPPSFAPPSVRMSFGHFTLHRSASDTTAPIAVWVSPGEYSSTTLDGINQVHARSPVLDCHELPLLPLPDIWERDRTLCQPGSDIFSASSMVDPHSSSTIGGVPDPGLQ